MPELEGKTVLITGSGSLGGIGADSALLFAQHGAEVLVAGRHTERGQQVVETILQAGGGRPIPARGPRQSRRRSATGGRGG